MVIACVLTRCLFSPLLIVHHAPPGAFSPSHHHLCTHRLTSPLGVLRQTSRCSCRRHDLASCVTRGSVTRAGTGAATTAKTRPSTRAPRTAAADATAARIASSGARRAACRASAASTRRDAARGLNGGAGWELELYGEVESRRQLYFSSVLMPKSWS